jgi:hypothetical protein
MAVAENARLAESVAAQYNLAVANPAALPEGENLVVEADKD